MKRSEIKKRGLKINSDIWDIFEQYGGYKYNDEMYYQLQGFGESLHEAMESDNDDSLEWFNKEMQATEKYFDWVKQVLTLENNEPEMIYC